MTTTRERIYGRYVTGRHKRLAPESVEGLGRRAPSLRQIVREHLPSERDVRILDVGCGYGAFAYFAREAGYCKVVGVDRSSEQVSAARRLGIEGVQEADLLDTLRGLPSASEDVIVALDVIEHFTKPELLGFIDEVFRVLKPGGRWIIHAPNGESPFAGAVIYGDFTHELAFTRTSLGQLLLSSGFESVECYEDRPHAQSLKGILRVLVWKAFRIILKLYLAAETGDTRDRILSQNLLAVAMKPRGNAGSCVA